MTSPGACPRSTEAAGWVMDTLAPDAAATFQRHLHTCADCTRLVERLRESVDLLHEAAAGAAPPPELRDHLMETVRADASPGDRRVPSRLAIGAAAAALVGVGVAAGTTVNPGDPAPQVQQFRGSVTAAGGGPRSKVAVRMREGMATLVLTDLAAPPEGRVYQAWIVRRPSVPTPTGTLFSVPRSGDTVVSLPDLRGVERVIVSAEPPQGSRRPSPPPVAEVLIGG